MKIIAISCFILLNSMYKILLFFSYIIVIHSYFFFCEGHCQGLDYWLHQSYRRKKFELKNTITILSFLFLLQTNINTKNDVKEDSKSFKEINGGDFCPQINHTVIKLPPVPHEVTRTASERHQKGLMCPWIYQVLTHVRQLLQSGWRVHNVHLAFYNSGSPHPWSFYTFVLFLFSLTFVSNIYFPFSRSLLTAVFFLKLS